MKRSSFSIFLATLLFISLGSWLAPALNAGEQDYYQRLKQSWVNMQKVFETLNSHYMEELDPYALVKAGIDGMLDHLDPYTVFIEEDGERRLKMITTGKYGGLGMEIGMKNKNITIITPMDNGPAKKAGIQAGDIIRKINGQDVTGWSTGKVSENLRGKIGGTVELTIERPGLDAPFTLTLTRAEIVIEDVRYAGYIAPGVGYISLGGFTDKAAREVKEAIKQLQAEGTLEKLILDLRGNPGGLLDAAVNIINLFVPAGEAVVSTRGFRESENIFKTEHQPLLPDTPLAILVNRGSASASEIVAGALQDLDRAVIIGPEPTFGKGLVQKVYTIDNATHTKLKITTAKYYIPSGRSIQKRDYADDNEVIRLHDADSLLHNNKHNVYYTRNKRKVLDKGGIEPDIETARDSLNTFMIDLIRQHTFFNFTVDYHTRHDRWNGQISDSLLMAFKSWMLSRDLEFTRAGATELSKLKKIIKREKLPQAETMLTRLENALRKEPATQFDENTDNIRRYLLLEMAEKYKGRKGRAEVAAFNDPVVDKARDVLQRESYKKILAIK
ncbi:MAG TPA: S41 family peptidase [Caldithrix abyssi]|uniref:S41 family peptidase n=1 Tax=Caldithrix abyssi TaxID=187145 RepID=A0A7V1LK42_CALAY|nr:S41 family peptidase [Caldithrix abyssi]